MKLVEWKQRGVELARGVAGGTRSIAGRLPGAAGCQRVAVCLAGGIADRARALHDWLRPWCERCGRRAIRHEHCDLCGGVVGLEMAEELRQNHATHGVQESDVWKAAHVCEDCLHQRAYARCGKTRRLFLLREDRSREYAGSKMRENLEPCHPDCRLDGPLSPEGLLLIEVEQELVQERLENWAGGTKHEGLPGHRIVHVIGTVRVEDECRDPAAVEHELRWRTAQLGGNGYIKCFWDRHVRHHEEEYIAGYGPKGNPYYRTHRYTTHHFTGHAVAVVAEPVEPWKRKRQRARR